MEKYYNSYNISYEKFTPEWFESSNQKAIDQFLYENAESMINFVESYFSQFNISFEQLRHKKVLVTGCGFGGLCHYFAKKGAYVTGVDVSGLAIMGAREIAKNKGLSIEYYALDVCHDPAKENFDYIFDDHLLHCLTTATDRTSYLMFIKNSLSSEGIFMLESMVFHNKVQTPVGFFFDENNVLWQALGPEQNEVMIRKIAPSIELEEEIIAAGLTINYLYYHSELAFQVFADYPDYPFEYLPRTVRVVVKK